MKRLLVLVTLILEGFSSPERIIQHEQRINAEAEGYSVEPEFSEYSAQTAEYFEQAKISENRVSSNYTEQPIYEYFDYRDIKVRKCLCPLFFGFNGSDCVSHVSFDDQHLKYETGIDSFPIWKSNCSDFSNTNHSSVDSALQHLSSDDACIEKHINKLGEYYWNLQQCHQEKKDCKNKICVRKLCKLGTYFSEDEMKCKEGTSSVNLFTFVDPSQSGLKVISPPDNLEVYFGIPDCIKGTYSLIEGVNEKFFLLFNGSLIVKSYRNEYLITPMRFSIEVFKKGGNSRKSAIICFPEEEDQKEKCNESRIYPAFLCLSCIFLLLTLVVYTAVPELHKKTERKCLYSHVLSLFFAFASLVVVQWGSHLLPIKLCILMGLIVQFTFLSSFFWLNAMCFVFWMKLRANKPYATEITSQGYFKYSIYAWGSPAVITIITAIMQFLPDSIDKSGLILPLLGEKGCFFKDYESKWVYFYGFVLVLNVMDILFLIHIAIILVYLSKNTRILHKTHRKQHNEGFWFLLKIFAAMGLTWIFEVISWLQGDCHIWMVIDIINILRGFFIFLIYVCDMTVLQMVAKRLKCSWFVSKSQRRLAATTSPRTSQVTNSVELK